MKGFIIFPLVVATSISRKVSGSLVGIRLGMSFLQADCFRTKEGERKEFQNIPRTVKVLGSRRLLEIQTL